MIARNITNILFVVLRNFTIFHFILLNLRRNIYFTGDDYFESRDLESSAAAMSYNSRNPISIIVPIYRRECHKEVYVGSHIYPGQGVYLLKFDNSFSIWRSKTLYYKVYYERSL